MTFLHKDPEKHFVAEEGPFAAVMSSASVLHYFPVTGRAEPIRLLLSYVSQPWVEPDVRPIWDIMTKELSGYPFRQLPRYVSTDLGEPVDVVEANAILRHLGRVHGLYGASLAASAEVDMVLEGVRDLRETLKGVIVQQAGEEGAKRHYVETILAGPEKMEDPVQVTGPVLYCLEHLLLRPYMSATAEGGQELGGEAEAPAGRGAPTALLAPPEASAPGADVYSSSRRTGGTEDVATTELAQRQQGRPWFVGNGVTIVDFAAFDLVDLNMKYFPDTLAARFPRLVGHHDRLAQLPGVKEYLHSANRHTLNWLPEWIG